VSTCGCGGHHAEHHHHYDYDHGEHGHCEHEHRGHCHCDHGSHCHCDHGRCHHGHCGCPGGGPGGGGAGGSGRPVRQPGTSTGQLNGGPITPGQLTGVDPPGVWPGPRQQMWLPYLLIRAFPGDTGSRPVAGVFWESPDVYILPGVSPAAAPDVPGQLGQVGQAGQDNTVYAHVWNLGRAPARDVVVEFYWCNPALGFNPAGANLIGTAYTSLGARGSGFCHQVVKCPVAWVPTYVNGGHECLLIRAWDVAADPMSTPEWDAAQNRHLGQRNIHVVPAGQAMPAQITLTVGQLFGQPAQITVGRAQPTTMPWLQLHSMTRGAFPANAVPTGLVAIGAPGGMLDQTGLAVTGDGQQIALGSSDGPPAPGSAHVYRVTASQNGQVFGGYSVVVLG
jgi:hypothetical protein